MGDDEPLVSAAELDAAMGEMDSDGDGEIRCGIEALALLLRRAPRPNLGTFFPPFIAHCTSHLLRVIGAHFSFSSLSGLTSHHQAVRITGCACHWLCVSGDITVSQSSSSGGKRTKAAGATGTLASAPTAPSGSSSAPTTTRTLSHAGRRAASRPQRPVGGLRSRVRLPTVLCLAARGAD